jgi:DNA-binding NtrC family response regulator
MNKKKVLVIDDEEVIRDLLKKVLYKEGYDIYTAANGISALEKIKTTDYDMLLLDLKMPKMGGMELLAKIKKLNKNPIIIIVTGYGTINTAKEAIKLGYFDYIIKPFNVDDIIIVIKKAFKTVNLRR